MPDFDKHWRPTHPQSASASLENRADELRASLRLLDPEHVAARSGISYLSVGADRGELHCPLWGKRVVITWPGLIAYNETDDELPAFLQTLLLYYLNTSDGISLSENWVSFAELPDGRMYNIAFQGYTGDEIAKTFGLDLDAFKSACEKTGGKQVDVGDTSFTFQALPRVPVFVTYWPGDEDFPSSCKILFDSSATHYLPIDGCAIVGSMLARMLIK